jgi:glycosyltransferase involved in cell wall biosynthesis
LFASLGGFDPRYAPAYFEDSDLAFRLREAGYKVLYEPRAVVEHLEGVSHGTDPKHGIKACQDLNRDTFVARWADLLATQRYKPGTPAQRARDRAQARRIVLVIDHRVPEPDRDAGSRTMLAFVQALLQAGAVVKFWSNCPVASPVHEAALQALGVEVPRGSWRGFADWISLNGPVLNHVLLSRPDVAEQYLPLLRRYSRAGVAVYGHDLHHVRLRQQAIATRDPRIARAAERMLRLERRVWRAADVVFYPSQAEADRVTDLEPVVVARAVQPYGFADFAQPRRPARRQMLLFVAGFAHPPNEDAACWLARDIMPLVHLQAPLARLVIVGSHPTERVRELAHLGVTIVANVSDAELGEWYAMARVAIIPRRQGAGVKRKVVEALRGGLPLVTTPVGAQGLPGLYALASVCDTAETIAASIVALLGDDDLWAARSEAGIAYARAHFSIATLRTSLCLAMGVADATSLAGGIAIDSAGTADAGWKSEAPSAAIHAPTRFPAGGLQSWRTALPPGSRVRGQGFAALPGETAQHGEPLLEVGDQIAHVLQPDMQPHQRAGEMAGGRGARDEAGGRQRQALEAAPGRTDAEQRERLDKRIGTLH